MDDKYYSTHCASCGKKDPPLVRSYCGECFHPYLIPKVGLVFHDWWDQLKFGLRMDGHLYLNFNMSVREIWKERGKYFLKSLIPRRFSKIVGCPCCGHDL